MREGSALGSSARPSVVVTSQLLLHAVLYHLDLDLDLLLGSDSERHISTHGTADRHVLASNPLEYAALQTPPFNSPVGRYSGCSAWWLLRWDWGSRAVPVSRSYSTAPHAIGAWNRSSTATAIEKILSQQRALSFRMVVDRT
jgi:hypothetical protein